MSVVRTLIGNVKGPKGDTGSQGPQGVAGTIEIGSVQTVSYGSPASVTNSGTEEEAILDFQIPQGAPGAQVKDMSNLVLSSITDSTADYPAFAVSETGSTIFGKIRKFLSDLKNNYVSKSMMTISTDVDTAGQAVADAKAIKSLNDSLSNTIDSLSNTIDSLSNTIDSLPKCTPTASFVFSNYTWTRSAQGLYYTAVPLSSLFPNITFNNILGIKIVNFAALRETDWFIPYFRDGGYIHCMCPTNAWASPSSEFAFQIVYN